MVSYPLRTVLALAAIVGVISSVADSAEPLHSLVRKHVPWVPRHSPMIDLAKDITAMERDIRATGSITVKTPDVWGEKNLMSYIQDFESLMAPDMSTFNANVQTYIARNDQATLTGQFALGQGLSGTPATVTAAPTAPLLELSGATPGLFASLTNALAQVQPTVAPNGKPTTAVGIEPTELERQRAEFLKVNQALRRKNIGDDNSRAAGYGLYLFRMPVSILPGRETFEGHSAVVNVRAQLDIDQDHLRNTYPQLVIADVVEDLAVLFENHWSDPEWNDHCSSATAAGPAIKPAPPPGDGQNRMPPPQSKPISSDGSGPSSESIARPRGEKPEEKKTPAGHYSPYLTERSLPPGSSRTDTEAQILELYGCEAVHKLLCLTRQYVPTDDMPHQLEIRNFLTGYLGRAHMAMTRLKLYDSGAGVITSAAQAFATGNCSGLESARTNWNNLIPPGGLGSGCRDVNVASAACPSGTSMSDNCLVLASWCLAAQAGLLNHNLRETWRSMQRTGDAPGDPHDGMAEQLDFFRDEPGDEALFTWQHLIRKRFPIYVFTLDPDVEEQNVYDAYDRRRDLQLAAAYAVASGTMNAQMAMQFSRQLDLNLTALGLNRVTVGFAHGNDTFGWYFYPRIQSPPSERCNLAVIGRLLWSGGPTEHYDMKHQRLEPGIRECEVLVAMPSFVPRVRFDVTTNWERLTRPGCVKRTYREMLTEARRLEQIRCQLRCALSEPGYRPGDGERLVSRIDQLEAMLPLQTYNVGIPYQSDLASGDLINTGIAYLRPSLQDYYGLQVSTLPTKTPTLDVFLVGRNFHPTQTYVIASGMVSQPCSQAAMASDSSNNGNSNNQISVDQTSKVSLASYASNVTPDDGSGGSGSAPALDPQVKVLSRDLLLVRLNLSSPDAAGDSGVQKAFSIRVGTPAGVSNELLIPKVSLPSDPVPAPQAAR